MSTYHLHIPRTSGVFIRNQIIKNHNENNFLGHTEPLPKSFKTFSNVSGHFATTPIKDLDINFAIIRNPVDLTLSYINYMRDNFYSDLSLFDLINIYIKNEVIENFVNINSKFLTGSINIDKYNQNVSDLKVVAESGWYIEKYSGSKNASVEIIQNNKTKILIFEDPEVYSKASSIYNIDNNETRVNSSSLFDLEEIFSHIELLTELNSMDIDLYNHFYQML